MGDRGKRVTHSSQQAESKLACSIKSDLTCDAHLIRKGCPVTRSGLVRLVALKIRGRWQKLTAESTFSGIRTTNIDGHGNPRVHTRRMRLAFKFAPKANSYASVAVKYTIAFM